MTQAVKRLSALVFVLMLCLSLGLVLSACSSSESSGSTDRASQNRNYMSQLNTGIDELRLELENFAELATTGDVVAMRTAADSAQSIVERLRTLSVPEDMNGISEAYLAGCDDLQQALNDYVQLYGESQNEGLSVDAFNDRLATVRSLYDTGMEHLQEGDDLAKNL